MINTLVAKAISEKRLAFASFLHQFQWEHGTHNSLVPGSSPGGPTILHLELSTYGTESSGTGVPWCSLVGGGTFRGGGRVLCPLSCQCVAGKEASNLIKVGDSSGLVIC